MKAVSSSPLLSSLSRLALPVTPRAPATVAAPVQPPADNPLAVQGPEASSDSPVSKHERDAVRAMSPQELQSQIRTLQAKMDKINPALAFVQDQESGRTLIQLTDRATKEVIKQFPSEAVLQIGRALDQFEKGQLVSKVV